MNNSRRTAGLALAAAGIFWGASMALSKLSMTWLAPGWLTVARFGLAFSLLAFPARRHLRAALRPEILTWGSVGLGGCVVVQNIGLSRTSVSHASLMAGAVPVIVAVVASIWHRTRIATLAWVGLLASFLGVAAIAGGGGGGSSVAGDLLVLTSLCGAAVMTVAQVRMLEGRDPMAVTAVQFLGGAVAAVPIAAWTERAPGVPAGPTPVFGVVGLAVFATMVPWTLFAFGQARVSAVVAGAFLNIEPLVGATLGALFFGDAVGLLQLGGGLAILSGVALSTMPVPPRNTTVTPTATTPTATPVATLPEPVPLQAATHAVAPRHPPHHVPPPRRAIDDVPADSPVLDRWLDAA